MGTAPLSDVPSDDPGADPGWRAALRYAAFGLAPAWGLQLRKSGGRTDGLVLVRGAFVSFVSAFVLIGIVVWVLEANAGPEGSVSATPASVAVAIVGLASVAGSALDRPLACEDDSRLAKRYTQRFFLRVALAEAAALAGFVAFLVTGSWWIYALGALFTAIGFWRLAPTTTHLREDEERLREAGCARSLVVALRENPPRGGLNS